MGRIGTRKQRHIGRSVLVIIFAFGLACLAFAGVADSRASNGSFVATDWVRRYDKEPANNGGSVAALTIDGQGNLYVTGSAWSGSSTDFLTIKYSPNGRKLWARRYKSKEDYYDYAVGIAVDGQGNVYITGYSVISWDSPGIPKYTIFVTVKYDTNGLFLWQRHYSGPVNDRMNEPLAIAVDLQGIIYITGYSWGGNGTAYDYATIKYGPDGQELWVRRYNGQGGNSSDGARAIAVDGQGNVYVTGGSAAPGAIGYYATIKYSPDGEKLWVRRYHGPGNSGDAAYAIALDSQGNVLVTGSSAALDNFYTRYDYATIKYSPEGQKLWVRRYHGPGNYDNEPTAIAVDAQDNVYVTGSSFGWSDVFGWSRQLATIKYSPEGRKLWARRYNGPENNGIEPSAMAVDAQGNVYVTGSYIGWSNASEDYWEFATVKYGPDGRRLWVRRYKRSNIPHYAFFSRAMAVDQAGNVYVTGDSYLYLQGYGYLTIKYTQTP